MEPRGIEDTLVCTPARRSASERHGRSDQMGSISLSFVPLIKNPPLGAPSVRKVPRGGSYISGYLDTHFFFLHFVISIL